MCTKRKQCCQEFPDGTAFFVIFSSVIFSYSLCVPLITWIPLSSSNWQIWVIRQHSCRFICVTEKTELQKRDTFYGSSFSYWQAGFLTHRLSDVSPEVFRISQVCRFAFSHICAMTVLKLRLHTVAATVQAFYLIPSHKTPTLCAELIHLLVIQLRNSNCNTGCF